MPVSMISIKTWKGSEFGGNKCTAYDRIANHYCMNYCYKCWKNKNEKLHEEVVKRKITINWQKKHNARAL